ncbi:MAG: PIG-L family deacetylase [Candidatus Margulisiibacteriota bacterium]
MKKYLYGPASVEIFKNSDEIGRAAADHIIQLVKTCKDAVIILPTGDTPRPMYAELVRRFELDRTIDFSEVVFFNLDEYIGLGKDHPLSYSYYMNKIFYEKLDKIGPSRAPKKENRHIPFVEKSQKPALAAKYYNQKLKKAIDKTGREMADLVILGVGGAYPVKNSSGKYIGIKGGHIGFNEPGSKINDKARPVTLTKKTMIDTAFRFMNLHICEKIYKREIPFHIPAKALTLGIANILESRKILLLANMEEKMPVIKHLYELDPSPNFPASYLKYHSNVHWLLDRDAASELPHIKAPWKIYKEIKWDKTLIREAVLEVLEHHHKSGINSLKEQQLLNIGIPYRELEIFGGINTVKNDTSKYLKDVISTDDRRLLPSKKRIVIFSPHPDDDAITMAATIKKLKENNNDIWIVYMVSGENAVRNTEKAARKKFGQYLSQSKLRYGIKNISGKQKEEFLRQARIATRQEESRAAADILGIAQNRLIFLNLPYYYHRGLIDVAPIDPVKDVLPVRELILNIRPQHVFYSAEADPHGAHGLCAKIMALAFEKLPQFWIAAFWGYRGAYEEWSLHKPDGLVIVPFDKKLMAQKIKCIKAHVSQLDPIFPSFDHRKFYERAQDRNRTTGRLLEQMGYLKGGPNFAEIFRRISYAEFIRTR